MHNSELEEIIEMSLEGVTLFASEVHFCSQWVVNNVQKFGKMMGVLLIGMENLSYLSFLKSKRGKC